MRVIPRRRRSREPGEAMTIIEHLSELRRRVLYALYALAFGAVIGWFLFPPFMDLIREPYCAFIRERPNLAPPTGCRLVFNGLMDAMLVRVKTTLFLGLAIALPLILYQLWMFIVPGLTSKERRYAIPFVASSFILFLAGGAAAYFVLPKSLNFLLGFAGEAAVPLITIDRYVGFVTLLTLAFGLAFLFPVLLVFLQMVGVIRPESLANIRRYAIVIIAFIAALITPGQDPVSMIAMMVPMYVFYEASIIVGRFLKR